MIPINFPGSLARTARRIRWPAWGLAICWPIVAHGSAAPGRVSVEPGEIHLTGAAARQQVAVTGHWADGSIRDLTAEAHFGMGSAGVAQVSATGVVTPVADGAALLRVEAEGQVVEVPVRVAEATRVRPVSFRLDVMALLSKAGCNMGACHGNFNGKNGFRLSLRGGDPRHDLEALTRDAFGRRIDRGDPARSLIVRKPTGQLAHEGGLRFPVHSPEARMLLGWVGAGADDDVATAPRLTKLTVFPAERILAPTPSPSPPGTQHTARGTQQLVVTAEFADGSRRDVTRQAAYDVSEPAVTVTPDGCVEAAGPVEVTVAVRYLDGRGVSRLAVLADRPDFAWRDVPVRTAVDAAVFAKLRAIKVNPSAPAADAVFLRRASLDALGILPTADEARAFLADPDPGKRAGLVDRLLAHPEFADFWALKWADLLRNEEKTMGEKGVWVFQRWLRDQIAADLPLDALARRIVSARGSTYRNPPSSFYRTNRDPQTCAETFGQVFLGVRLQCAKCHNHPFDVWTQDDYYGLSAYFANIERKQVNNVRRDDLDKHEINGDEIIYLTGRPQTVQPSTGVLMDPKPPGGPRPRLGGDPDALDDLAEWLTRDNPQFARNLANRIWFHLMGRGVVDPVDDFRDSNPPSNPALLEAITAEFVAGGMRLKPLVASIMKSEVYGLGSTPNATNADDEINFARATVRLLPAEVLLDALGAALGRPESFPDMPRTLRAVQLPGARMGGEFLKVFGKPDRLLTCECERSEATTLAQAFQLINGEAIRHALEAGDNRIGRLLRSGTPDATILSDLYLASLGREPTDRERRSALSHVSRAGDRRKAWEDVAWAILNSKEFLLRH
jgi:hypothetical protein